MSAELALSLGPRRRICSGPHFQLLVAANALGISWLKLLCSDLCPHRHKAVHPLHGLPWRPLSAWFCPSLSSACLFILAALGLPCCAVAFSSCGEWGLLSGCCWDFSLRRLLLFWTTGSGCAGLRSCGARPSLPQDMWNLPEPVIDLMSPALTDACLTTELPGNPCLLFFYYFISFIYFWLGLCCRTQAFSSCGGWGPLFAAITGFSSPS